MLEEFKKAWKTQRHWVAAGFLVSTILFAVLLWASYWSARRGIAEQKETGLAASALDPIANWQQWRGRSSGARTYYQKGVSYDRQPTSLIGGIVGGVPGGVMRTKAIGSAVVSPMMAYLDTDAQQAASQRMVVRISAMEIVAANPTRAAEQVRELGSRLSGWVESSKLMGADVRSRSAEVVINVPAERLEEARAEVRKLAMRVDSDTTEARDVTREAVDEEASLRNYRAEEAQYLTILKRATAVKDVLEVTSNLDEVRGNIDRLEAQLKYLRQQVAMSRLTVSIVAQAEAQVMGIEWRPLYQTKLALRGMLSGLADFADSVVALLLYLPVIVAWVLLGFVVVKVGWIALVRTARVFFPGLPRWRKSPAPGV